MKVVPTPLHNAVVIEPEPRRDDRGWFVRTFCRAALAEHGIDFPVCQANLSGNVNRGTLRGLHYQVDPVPEAKLIQCIRGAIFDLMVDMDPASPTYRRWFGVELTEENRKAVYVPPMFAHGYLALADGAEAFYLATAPYTPACERGVRYDDPGIGIELPIPATIVSEKDRAWPDLPVS